MSQPTMDVTREKLLRDFHLVVADTEELLKSAAAAGGDKAHAWRGQVEQNLKAAKEKLVQLEHEAVEKARVKAREADTYVHQNPWQSIGVAAGVGVLAGLALGLLLNRK